MSKHKFPKDILRFFNSPVESPRGTNQRKKQREIAVYVPRVYSVKGKLYRIPARAIIDKLGAKKYVPAW